MKVLSIQGNSADEFLSVIRKHKTFKWVELRADEASMDLDIQRIRTGFKGKIIFTCRDFENDPKRVQHLYSRAIDAGVDYLDVDMEFYLGSNTSFRNRLEQCSQKLVISFHNYLDSRITREFLEKMFQVPAALYKVGVKVSDTWESFSLLKARAHWRKPVLLALMGECGEWSRVCYKHLQNPWTYLCVPGKQTAPGQVDPLRWKIEFGRTPDQIWDLYGILGGRVEHSYSPYFHNQFFKRRKLKATYQRFPVQNLDLFFQLIPEELKGLSVTTPFKRSVIPYLSSCDHLVEASGSCNTLRREGEEWIGYNTDASGLRSALDQIMPGWVEKEKIVILGAGGLARSALAALCDHKERIHIWNRTEYKARELAEKFEVHCLGSSEKLDLRETVLIQATSAGFFDPEESPIPLDWLTSTTTLVESIYHPRYTRLVTEAMGRGYEVLQAIELFLYQALHQQRIWYGELGLSLEEGRKVLR